MITLNLLPPEEKQKIESVQAQRRILSLASAGLTLILIFLAFLSSIWLFLTVQLNSADLVFKNIQASSQNEVFKKLESEIKQINEKLDRSEALKKGSRHYSFALEKLTELSSYDIKFTSLSVSENKISLSGLTASREALLAFKDSLSQSPYFDKINMPLSNFLKQTDINFSVSFEIK